jgi:uncharacterized repeat protein (TIGR01451 family)
MGRPEEFVRLSHPGLGLSRIRIILVGVMLLAMGATALKFGLRVVAPAQSRTAGVPAVQPAAGKVRASYGHLPLIFEPNQGQTDARVKFLARGQGYGLFLTADQAVLQLQHPAKAGSEKAKSSVVRMKLADANPNPEVRGESRLPGVSNYFVGNNPSSWHTEVPQFARVSYRGVYPGIDLAYYGKQGKLEYDFNVAPGADPKRVALVFEGIEKMTVDADGELVLTMAGNSIRLHAPSACQMRGGAREPVTSRFVMLAGNKVGFEIGTYDQSRELVIDPILTYSTYLGGSGAETLPQVAVDSGFNFYVAGSTASTNFPTTSGVLQTTLKGAANVFITKFDSNGSAIAYSTYLGGNGTDASVGIGVDQGFNVYVAGTTSSSNFPTVGGFQSVALSSGNHVFAAQLNSSGTALLYSTYLSGTGSDVASGMAIDTSGDIFVTGTTTSSNFPTTPGAFQTPTSVPPVPAADNHFFASEVSTALQLNGTPSLIYSTYFGGGNPSNGLTQGGGITVDTSGNIYLTGGTNFLHLGNTNDFPILNAYQACLDQSPPIPAPNPPPACSSTVTATDAFVAKLNPKAATGAQLLYSTYLGGSADDVGNGIAVDDAGNAYVTGSTASTDIVLPTTIAPYQPVNRGGIDAFLAKIGNQVSGSTVFPVNYMTFYGGSGTDIGLAITVDTSQNAHFTGSTDSSDLTTNNAVQTTLGGGTDAFVALLSTTTSVTVGTQGIYSTYLGGSGNDRGTGIAIDANGVTYVVGDTNSTNFPTSGGPVQPSLGGSTDAFVTKLGATSTLQLAAGVSPNPVGVGNNVTFTYVITNAGPDTASNILFTNQLPATGASFSSITATPGSCTAPSSGSVTCSIGSLAVNSTATVTLVLTPTTATTLGNTGCLVFNGQTCGISASTSVEVSDFSVTAQPNSATVTAGSPATFQVTIAPLPTYPESISLACSAGLPTGASCTFSTTPVTISNTSPVSSTLVLNTTQRITTVTDLRLPGGPIYATWLPVSGLALLGLGFGKRGTRRRKAALALALTLVLVFFLMLPACSTSTSKTTTTGTPAGTYTVTVSGVSGSTSHTSVITLVVQ